MGPLLELGPSTDPVGLSALVVGVLLLAFGLAGRKAGHVLFMRGSRVAWVGGVAFIAALLSAGYIAYFLRGGPRIIDATSYFLEGRALSEGKLAWAVPEPTAAFRGRFSLFGPEGLAVIFPPGYPLALALGFRLGAPLIIGPLIAALLVLVTYLLAKELELGEAPARLAAVLSTTCAALRYHTADTMSHGLSGLLLAATLTLALRPTSRRTLLAGLCAGWLLATRPMTGVVAVAVAVSLLALRGAPERRVQRLVILVLGLVPGLALLAAHQRAATGSWFHSTQLAYYALADGPPGCFRWGFGAGVGCRFEHADFVKKHLADGFGLRAALYVTGERLLWHAFDVVNVAVAAPLVPWFIWKKRAIFAVRSAGAAIGLVVAAYAPFYFPGSYPGGGARLLADALPIEHALLGGAFFTLGLESVAPALVVFGFALSTIHAHLALRDRDGGHPMFDQRVLAGQGVSRGLVWVEDDHGFALGHDPAMRDPRNQVLVARRRGDAHDWALWDGLGRPASFSYRYSTETGVTSLTPRSFDRAPVPWRWEAEAEWPALAVEAGYSHPDFRPCLSGGSALRLIAEPKASVVVELAAPERASYSLLVGWLASTGARLTLGIGDRQLTLVHRTDGCETASVEPLMLDRMNRVRVTTESDVLLDYLELAGPVAK
jgi:hypothetical protein